MDRLTIDEAIAHAREVASEQKRRNGECVINDNECDKFSNCIQCAEEHEQLAEWLEELKAFEEIFLKHLQDGDIVTSFAISTYKKDLEILSCIDFNKIIDAVGADAEQALEDCVSAMELFLPILEAVNILSKDNEQE